MSWVDIKHILIELFSHSNYHHGTSDQGLKTQGILAFLPLTTHSGQLSTVTLREGTIDRRGDYRARKMLPSGKKIDHYKIRTISVVHS